MPAIPLSPSILPHNDLHIDAGGNLVMVTGAAAIGQHIRQRLMFWKGEWFLDTLAGVDWRGDVFSLQPQQKELVDATIKAEIIGTPGVVDIEEYSSRYDRANRGLIVDRVVVRVDTGATVVITF
mgnify:CR=1 FL=1